MIREEGAGEDLPEHAPRSADAALPASPPQKRLGRNGLSWRGWLRRDRSREIIAVDFQDDAIRIVQKSLSFPFITRHSCPVVPQRDRKGSGILANARTLQKDLEMICQTDRPAVWVIPPADMVQLYTLQLPKGDLDKKATDYVMVAFKRKFPKFDETHDIMDFRLVDEVSLADRALALVYVMEKKDANRLRQLFSGIGYSLAGITPQSFALEHLMISGLNKPLGGPACAIFLGMKGSTISFFSAGGALLFSRHIKTGLSGMVARFDALKLSQRPAGAGRSGVINIKRETAAAAQPSTLPETDDPLFRMSGKPEKAILPDYFLNALDQSMQEGSLKTFSPVFDRLIWQMERSIDFFQEQIQPAALDQVIIFGGRPCFKPLSALMADRLDCPVTAGDALMEAQNIAHDIGTSAGGEAPLRASEWAPGLGLALSSGDALPNFLDTYRDRSNKERIKRIDRLGFVAFLAISIACAAGYGIVQGMVQKRGAERSRIQQTLDRQLEADGVYVTPAIIERQVASIQSMEANIRAYAHKRESEAYINGVCAELPPDIQLYRLDLMMNPPSGNSGANTSASRVEVEGIVGGEAAKFEATLFLFMTRLKAFQFFDQPEIVMKRKENLKGRPVMRFTLKMDILR